MAHAVDLRGLWSTSVIGGQRRWWSKPVGAAVVGGLLLSWVGGALSPLVVLWLLYARCYAVAVGLVTLLAYPYLAPMPSRAWPAACRLWMLGAHYFDEGCSMSFEERRPNDLSAPQISCYHPHGMFVFGLVFNSGFRFRAADTRERWRYYCGARLGPYPHVGLISSALCKAPIFSHVVSRWSLSTAPVSKRSMNDRMRRGDSFGVVLGGFEEATAHRFGHERVFVRRRKGLVKYALQYGYKVCPAYTFGESYTYRNLVNAALIPAVVKAKLNAWGVPTVLPCGAWWCPPLPMGRRGLHTVVSSGRQFPRFAQPTAEQVDEYHQWYVDDLVRLFNTHKARFGIPVDAQLEIL